MNKELKQFLIELTALSIKHGIYIGGCGCCGSPSLYKGLCDNDEHTFVGDDLRFDEKNKEYEAYG